jgi:hypothetical protein
LFLDRRSFWLEMGRRLFQSPDGEVQELSPPSDSYEVMKSLDHDLGIPADQFLDLFHVCMQCGHVMTRYWAEDHPQVCPA